MPTEGELKIVSQYTKMMNVTMVHNSIFERLAMFVRSRAAIRIDAAVWDDIRSEL